jgi:hypothetical protein
MQPDVPSTFWVPKSTSNSWIPEGYVLITGPDNQDYIAPEFMVPVLDQDFNAKEKKKELKVSGALGTVSRDSGIYSPLPAFGSPCPETNFSYAYIVYKELRGHQSKF